MPARDVREAGFPGDLAGFLVGGDDAARTVGGRDDVVAPQRGTAALALLLLLGVHAPDDAADIARGAVDLVEHAPRIRDVQKAVLGERRRLVEFVAGIAAERHRVSELEVPDVVAVDPGERREPLTVIGAVVHQPVLRLLVGAGETLRRYLGGGRR
jgi:hypothetical protein